MTNTEYNKIVKSMKQFGKELRNDPDKAEQFLKDAGILTPSGNIAKPYRPSKTKPANRSSQ